MKLMTYNILKGGEERLSLLLDVIAAQGPDVLALQECNGFAAGSRRRLRQVESAFGMRGVLGQSRSGYDVALLAAPGAWRGHRTLKDGFERAAVVGDLAFGGGTLRVAALHLDPYDPGQRLAEVEYTLAAIDVDRDAVVLGDLNAISPRDVGRLDTASWPARYRTRHGLDRGPLDTRAVAALEARGLVDLAAAAAAPGAPRSTRPTALVADRAVPDQRLDYVFASPAVAARAQHVEIVDDVYTQRASDHLPVVVTIA